MESASMDPETSVSATSLRETMRILFLVESARAHKSPVSAS